MVARVGLNAFLLVAALCLLSNAAYATSCFPPIPTYWDIIKAPVIFTGKPVEVIDKIGEDGKERRYFRFEVTRMYKGPKESTIEVLTSHGQFSAHFHFDRGEVTLIPHMSKTGNLSAGFCDSVLVYGYGNLWIPMVKKAYSTPFPTLYLLYKGYVHIVFAFVFFGLPFLLLVVHLVRRAMKKREVSNGR